MAKYQRHKIVYCTVCGYVDLTQNEHKCPHCELDLNVTDEYFDEICSQLEFTNKDEVEEYVRQLYVYINDNFNEENMSDREDSEHISEQIEFYEETILNDNYTSKCPTCGSPNIEKISLGKKAFGGAMFGIFSSDVRKTMRCNNCGYKF